MVYYFHDLINQTVFILNIKTKEFELEEKLV